MALLSICKDFCGNGLQALRKGAVYCLVALLASQPVFAADGSKEYQVKAVFLYNFINFVTWPLPAPISNPTICVYGADPFGATLDYIVQRDPQQVKPQVRRIDQPAEVQGCQIVYISRSAEAQLSSILEAANRHGVLTVSDIERFTHKGGIIGYIQKEEKVKLEINSAAYTKVGLKISAKLLEMAELVN